MLTSAGLALAVIGWNPGKNALRRFWAPALDSSPVLVVVETLMGVQKPLDESSKQRVTEILDPKLFLIVNDSNSRLAAYFSANGSSLEYELARNVTLARLRTHPLFCAARLTIR